MSELPPSFRTQQWNGLFAPLNLTAFITWAAVAVGPLLDWAHHRIAWTPESRVGMAALLVFPALYTCRCLDPGQPHEVAERHARALTWLQGAVGLVACWGMISCCGVVTNRGALPVLLIIVAGQMAVLYSPRVTLLNLLCLNLPLAALLAQRWPLDDVLVALFAYGSFEAFSALTLTYAKRAELARDEAQRSTAELFATRRLLLESARGEERLRLSRDLHDVVGHKLTALKLQLRMQARQAQAPGVIAECERLADELLADVRGVVGAMRRYEGIELQQALAALVPALQQPQVSLELAPEARAADLAQAQALLRCAQEGLTNALRHSGAERVLIRLQAADGGLLLSVEDDGRARQLPQPGNGLRGMRERLEGLGGRLELALREGGGLRLSAWLPPAEAA
jgi:signal transduction histidine kinase